jgi:hypothetical protein
MREPFAPVRPPDGPAPDYSSIHYPLDTILEKTPKKNRAESSGNVFRSNPQFMPSVNQCGRSVLASPTITSVRAVSTVLESNCAPT